MFLFLSRAKLVIWKKITAVQTLNGWLLVYVRRHLQRDHPLLVPCLRLSVSREISRPRTPTTLATGRAPPTEEASNLKWVLPEVTCTTRRWLPPEVAVLHHQGLASQCLHSSNRIQAINSTVDQRAIPIMGLALLTPGHQCLDIHLALTVGPALATSRRDIPVIQVANSILAVGTTLRLLLILSNTHSSSNSSREWYLLVVKGCPLQGPRVHQLPWGILELDLLLRARGHIHPGPLSRRLQWARGTQGLVEAHHKVKVITDRRCTMAPWPAVLLQCIMDQACRLIKHRAILDRIRILIHPTVTVSENEKVRHHCWKRLSCQSLWVTKLCLMLLENFSAIPAHVSKAVLEASLKFTTHNISSSLVWIMGSFYKDVLIPKSQNGTSLKSARQFKRTHCHQLLLIFEQNFYCLPGIVMKLPS